MKQKKKKIGFLLGATLLCLVILMHFTKIPGLFSHQRSEKQVEISVIPHFMIKAQRVSDFYAFLQQKIFDGESPDQIVLLSPNHFYPQMNKAVSICQEREIKFKHHSILAQAWMTGGVICEDPVFYLRGRQWYTKDHGLGLHFPFISSYFPQVKKLYLILLPTHRMHRSKIIAEQIDHIPGKTLIIASVDFSHYQSENIAYANDQHSFSVLSQSGTASRLRHLDVDCPSCLGVVDYFAQKTHRKPHQRLRDSSSTIMGKDMHSENTSRQFLWRSK